MTTLEERSQSSGVEEAEWYNVNDPQGQRWALPDNLAESRMRHYAVECDGQLLARGATSTAT